MKRKEGKSSKRGKTRISVKGKAWKAEYARSGRSRCWCKKRIAKGSLRLGQIFPSPLFDGYQTAWYHYECVMAEAVEIEAVHGIYSLRWEDQQKLRTYINGRVSNKSPLSDQTSLHSAAQITTSSDGVEKLALNGKLEAQTRAFWSLMDDLKEYVSVVELRRMLDANHQSTTGLEFDLRGRCADGMMFGALEKCQVCSSGFLKYDGSTYKCDGYVSDWTKCMFSSSNPKRIKGEWKIPAETDNEWLLKWFKSQTISKPIRLLPALACGLSDGCLESSKDENLGDIRVVMVGFSKKTREEFQSKVEEAGGRVDPYVKNDTECLVVADGQISLSQSAQVEKAREKEIPIVKEAYLVNCIKRQKKLPFDPYIIEAFGESSTDAVNKDRQCSGHILEDGNISYNVTLYMCDLHLNVNSCYVLQIIEYDEGPDCSLLRKWGRVGEDFKGELDQKMSKLDAIEKFKKLFLDKSGNSWETFMHKQEFKKLPGKYFTCDNDNGVSKQDQKTNVDNEDRLIELLEVLYNKFPQMENNRAATREFNANMSKIPLGKLTRSNLQEGLDVLNNLKMILGTKLLPPPYKSRLMYDLSNHLFTVIPSTHPHAIRDVDDLEEKEKWLEALKDQLRNRQSGIRVKARQELRTETIDKTLDSSHPRAGIGKADNIIQATANQNINIGGHQEVGAMTIGDENVFVGRDINLIQIVIEMQ